MGPDREHCAGGPCMAQVVNTVVVDDLTGSEIPAAEATTVAWSWRGVDYEFDTRTAHLAAIEDDHHPVTVCELLAASRRVSGRRGVARPVTDPPRGSAASVRAWARERGIAVPDRGRVPQPVIDSYLADQPHSS